MKILHIIAMSPLSQNSGIPAVLKYLTDAQNKIDRVESIVLSIKGKVDEIDSPYFHYLGKEKIDHYLKRTKPDLAIIHCFFYGEYIQVVKSLIKYKIPFCNQPHGSFGRKAMKKSAIKKQIANHTVFLQQIKKAKAYIFTNVTEFNDSIYHTSKDIVIPNGVLSCIVNNSREKSKESLSEPVFYYLGRYDIHHKGLDYLFDAFDVLEAEKFAVQIKIFGTGDTKQLEYVNKRLSKLRIVNAKNCGPIYGDAKKKELEECNILLLTSRYEGSPMTVLDGFSYGNPCIVTPGTNVSEEVLENNLGWKSELDAQQIAYTIIRAYEEYKQNGYEYYSRCKQYVIANYVWDDIALNSIELYKGIINR